MTRDFDPYQIPDQFAAWLLEQPPDVRDRHAGIFATRAVAAAHVLDAVAKLREAFRATDDSRLPGAIRELLEVARSLHDYDPTSD